MAKLSIPCVILCGGKSTRMGKLKQDLVFGNGAISETLINFQIRRLREWFSCMYLSAKVAIPNVFGVETILDLGSAKEAVNLANAPKEQFAPIFGLQSILEFLQCDTFVLSVDAPFFDNDAIHLLWQSYTKNRQPTFAKNAKIHPLLGIYTLKSLAKIQGQIAKSDYKLMELLATIEAQFVEVNEEKTQNLNTPKDYQEALMQIKSKIKA